MLETIFVVDEEFEVCRCVRDILGPAGYSVRMFSTGNFLEPAAVVRPSVILLSLAWPDALKLCHQIRTNPWLAPTGIILLLTSASESARILALESGANDCLVKPLNHEQLLTNVHEVVHRLVPTNGRAAERKIDLVIDSWGMKLSVRGTEVPTTRLEFHLIEYLARHRGQVLERNKLLDEVWGESRFITPRSVDACVRRLREKIEPNHLQPILLKTVRGVGYRLDATAVWEPSPHQNCSCLVCRAVARSGPLQAAQQSRSIHPATSSRKNGAGELKQLSQ